MNKTPSVTPMMEQYLRIKEKHKDKLLFYRMGDFYELFFEDAEIAASKMDIVLTTRGKHLNIDIPMCGIPHLKLDQYLIKLIKSGHVIAICEQVETVDEAKRRGYKSIVRRDVTRIITPGTLVEEGHLESTSHNFLFTYTEKENFGSAVWLDLSTGSIFLKSVNKDSLPDLINEIKPSEIVLPEKIPYNSLFGKYTETPRVTFFGKSSFFENKSLDEFIKGFDEGNFSASEISSISSLIAYCFETNSALEMDFSIPIRISNLEFVEMDVSTRRNLELSRSVQGEKKDTLFNVINNTVTGLGSRLLENWLNYPLIKISEIDSRLNNVEALFENFHALETVRSLLRGIPDIERALTRLQLNRGSPRDLNYIKIGLLKSKEIDNVLREHNFWNMLVKSPINDLENEMEILDRSIEDNPPLNIKDGNFIKPKCSVELDKNRLLQTSSRADIAHMQTQLIQKTSINSLKIKFNNNLGYFIETPSGHSKKILSEEYSHLFIHRQSTANATRFTTHELLNLESKILNSRDLCLKIEIEKFEELRCKIFTCRDNIKMLCTFIAELDVFCSLSYFAKMNRWVRPEITEGREFIIKNGRHPIVERSLRSDGSNDFIPNDCELSPKKSLINLLTGPNMAGKSTFLRQNALIGILAQMGSFVPADSAKIGKISQIFCRIGASDNLAKGESTFMVEMRETALILNNANDRALVILDEIGRGTSTYDGMSIAWSCLEYLHDVNRSRTIFATHYHELTEISEKFTNIKNMSVSAKEWKGELIFLHKVLEGRAMGSYGIKVAQLAGLPSKVISNAEHILENFGAPPKFTEFRNDDKNSEDFLYYEKLDNVKKVLDVLDLDTTSPKDALEILYRIKGSIS